MAALGGRLIGAILLVVFVSIHLQPAHAIPKCDLPAHLIGQYFSLEFGDNVDTAITQDSIEVSQYKGECVDREDDNSTVGAENRHDSFVLFNDTRNGCYKCYELRYRTPNVIQYRYTVCQSGDENFKPPSLDTACGSIDPRSDYFTYFRKNYEVVNCKNTFEGVFNFSYEWNVGGGGLCESPESTIKACQEPGSQYVDNQVFDMTFGLCPGLSTSVKSKIRFYCLGSWTEGDKIWSAVWDIGEEVLKERFRCMLTSTGQEEGDNKQRYTLSWFADCSELKSPYEGPVRLMLQPVVDNTAAATTPPECNFPTNYSGHWYHAGEWDVDVDINATHIYFKTKIDEFNYKESYFVCLMNSGTRFLTLAITVGKCEVDYVCFDMMPRHHSIVRWRMSKPYRLGEVEQALPNYKRFMFQQACSWYSFTIDREDTDWNYKTFLLNPPQPVVCPIRGRYKFEQIGESSEIIQTRIPGGMTERPRHTIDCYEYVSEWKSCDNTPTKISLDAEYCETVDHTGRPVGEYDMPDWEMTCVGYWDEDWVNYMITWDPNDPTSAFRCWAYERDDWRFISVSRSTNAFCRPTQKPRSSSPKEGASLAMRLIENERLFDDCSQDYRSGDPWSDDRHYIGSRHAGATSIVSNINYVFSIIIVAASVFIFRN